MNKAAFFMLLLSTYGCSDGPDRFEDVLKLRGIGIRSAPVVAAPSTQATPSVTTLTFFAALPVGGTISSATPYVDAEGALTGLPAALTMVDSSEHYEDHASLRIYSVQAQLLVPPAEALLFDPSSGFATVHFGVQLVSDHGSQAIVGNVVVYPQASPQLAALSSLPSLAITAPTKNAVVGSTKQVISANLTPANNETFRVGWFVSGGNIDNRNAIVTKWDPRGPGTFTVIVTARGAQTAAFAMDVADVTSR